MTAKRELLVVLTNYFPFYRGEEYLETELPYLTEKFERVLVVPCMHEDSMEQTRQLPPGVELVAVHMPSSKVARVLHSAKNAPGAAASGLMKGTASWKRPKHAAFDWYFTTRGLELWGRLDEPLRRAIGDARDVSVYSYWLFMPAFVATRLRARLGPRAGRIVSRAHGYDINLWSNSLGFLPQRRLLVSNLDAVHPVSEAGRRSLLTDVPDMADKVSVRRLGVRAPSGRGERANRPRLEIVTCSSLKPVKRMPLVVETLAELARRGVPFRWTHFGGSGAQLEALSAEAAVQLPAGSYDFRGHVPNSAVLDHYATAPATVFLNLSSSEGVPVSIMEAMAHGIPAVATLAGGTGELVTEGRDGWTLPLDVDAGRAADALAAVHALSEAEYAGYSTAAQETWAAGWSADTVYGAFAAELAGVSGS